MLEVFDFFQLLDIVFRLTEYAKVVFKQNPMPSPFANPHDGNPSPVANCSKGACLSSCCPIDPIALHKKSTDAKKHEIYKIGPC